MGLSDETRMVLHFKVFIVQYHACLRRLYILQYHGNIPKQMQPYPVPLETAYASFSQTASWEILRPQQVLAVAPS